MENSKKKCYICRWYKAAYTKGFWKFDKQNTGYCVKYNKIVEKHESCEKWQYNTDTNRHIGRYIRKEACLKALYETLQTLAQITQFIEEEHEENKNDPLPPER